MIRSYPVKNHANPAKTAVFAGVLPAWKSLLTIIKQVKIEQMKTQGRMRKLYAAQWKALILRPNFTARQLKSAENQVEAALNVWAGKSVTIGRKIIGQRELTDEEKHEQFRLNKSKKFWEVPGLLQQILRENPFPTFLKLRTIRFDNQIVQPRKNAGEGFEDWLEFKIQHHKILVPIEKTRFFKQKQETWSKKGVYMVTVLGEELKIMRPFERSNVQKRTEGEVFALDWGLQNLFTDQHGNFYGEHLYTWLRKVDSQLLALQKELQKRGIKPKNSKRYRAFNRRIREHFRNVVGRIFNDFGRAGVQKIVLESLDFRAPNLGRTLNRVLSRFGRSEVRRKTEDIVEKYGITVAFVNPTYTSQQCSVCNFVSQNNRRSQERFLCQKCGFSAHADHNAAKNILWREQHSFPLLHERKPCCRKSLRFLSTFFHAVHSSAGRKIRSTS